MKEEEEKERVQRTITRTPFGANIDFSPHVALICLYLDIA